MDILWDYSELYGFIWGTNRKNQHHLKANDPVRYRLRSEQDGPISVNLLGGGPTPLKKKHSQLG